MDHLEKHIIIHLIEEASFFLLNELEALLKSHLQMESTKHTNNNVDDVVVVRIRHDHNIIQTFPSTIILNPPFSVIIYFAYFGYFVDFFYYLCS